MSEINLNNLNKIIGKNKKSFDSIESKLPKGTMDYIYNNENHTNYSSKKNTGQYGITPINIENFILKNPEDFGIKKFKDKERRTKANIIAKQVVKILEKDKTGKDTKEFSKSVALFNANIITSRLSEFTNRKYDSLTDAQKTSLIDRIWTHNPYSSTAQDSDIVKGLLCDSSEAVAVAMFNMPSKDNESDNYNGRAFYNISTFMGEDKYKSVEDAKEKHKEGAKEYRDMLLEEYKSRDAMRNSQRCLASFNSKNNTNHYYGQEQLAQPVTYDAEGIKKPLPEVSMPSQQKTQSSANMAQQTQSMQQVANQQEQDKPIYQKLGDYFSQAFDNFSRGYQSLIGNFFTGNKQNEQQTNENINVQ